MGGYAFRKPRYPRMPFPRMPTPQYTGVKAHVSTRLLQLFHHVGVGTEAPEKHDHGDVDFVVCRPRALQLAGASLNDVQERVVKSLGANFGKVVHGVLFLAIPMPEVGGGEDARVTEGEVRQQDFVQIDITMCPAPSLFAYDLFTVSYGDLFGFLKTGTRPFGLSFRPSGLWMRTSGAYETDVDDGDSSNGHGGEKPATEGDKTCLFFLSNDVDAILSFLGLDPSKWKAGFDSLEEIFRYVVSAKWFSREHFQRKEESSGGNLLDIPPASPSLDSATTSASSTSAVSGSTATVTTNVGANQNRRRNHDNSYEEYKFKKRPVWRRFVTEYLPLQNLPNDPFAPSPADSQPSEPCAARKRRDSAVGCSETVSDGEESDAEAEVADARAAVLAAALSHFPGAESRYHVLRATRAAAHRETLFWERVKRELPDLIAQRQRQQEDEERQWQRAEGADQTGGGGDVQDAERQRAKWAASGWGRVSKDRLSHTITALRRFTAFGSQTGDGNSGGEHEYVGMRVPRLRSDPVLDDADFAPWTSTFTTTTASPSDDDLMAFIADNQHVAYELDRSRSRPMREKKREEVAKRKAERFEREREERELEKQRELARTKEEEEEGDHGKVGEGRCVGQ